MRKANSPCFNCKDREPGCHGKCEKYRKYNEDVTARREKGRAEHEFGLSSSPEFTRYLRNQKKNTTKKEK